MNKNEYVNLYSLLAKLKYELLISTFELNNEESIKQIQNQIEAINTILQIMIID